MQIGAKKLVSTLESFKINAEVTNICRGPSVTRYELVPEAGVRINKITGLADDIALRLASTSVRIEAPIPGKAAIGIEIPNSAKSMVSMREIIDTPEFRDAKSKLNVALGKDITGNIICADLAKMPHVLVAGTTGSGKSVCLNSMIVSILYNASPDEVKLLMIDPKMVEFTIYNGIAHLEVPVVSNPRKAAGALGWAVGEMEKRYKQFSENSVRDIKGFNKLCETRDDLVKMHQIVIFIDELSDLMMVSPKEVEDAICRLAQMARAAGIHLVIATQRPSVDVITGIIKANIPSRIALSVSSQIDSRTILDASGAEKLLGNGDMLFNPVGASKPTRVQGCFISDAEVERVVNHIKSQAQTTYNEDTMHEIEAKAAAAENAKKKDVSDDEDGDWDPMLNDAIEVVVNAGGASTTMLQKKLKLGYARASRVMDQLEEKGIVGPSEGAKPRQVLLTKQQWYEMQALADGAGAAPNIDDVFADDDDFAGAEDDFE
ncbi:MAG: DNA translocase FtsK [Clostridia bacterium]|nr:DNA translocase FtsK [Clostridia bacterium]